MAHWNYRLVQHDDYVSMIEAHYDDKGVLYAWAEAGPVIGDDLEDITGELKNRLEAIHAPIIPISYLEEMEEDEEGGMTDLESEFKAGFEEGRP